MTRGKKVDLTGIVLNGIEVLGERRVNKTKYRLDLRCHCGKEFDARKDEFKNGKVKSCGCIPRGYYEGKHGEYKTKLYKNYYAMLDRCNNPKHKAYKNYGGRGVRVCDEWTGENGYLNFREWALTNGYSEKVTLDRIDVNGNYEPLNCRYVVAKVQERNKRNNWKELFNGEERLVIEICEEYGFSYNTLASRKNRGRKGARLFEGLVKSDINNTKQSIF